MKLNKDFQYSFLLCLYLARSGTANLKDIANNLKLSKTLLSKIVTRLKQAGLIYSHEKSKSEYDVYADVTPFHILQIFDSTAFLNQKDHFKYSKGEFETRALAQYASALGFQLYPLLSKTFDVINKEVSANEKRQFKGLEDTLEN